MLTISFDSMIAVMPIPKQEKRRVVIGTTSSLESFPECCCRYTVVSKRFHYRRI